MRSIFSSRRFLRVDLSRVRCNRGSGEGNGIGVEHARGEFVVFPNNDDVVAENWLLPLVGAVRSEPDVAAAGAELPHTDGSLQEAGATISPCGTAVHRGKHLDAAHPLFNRTEAVDCCSASALLVRAESFRAVLGFDLCWDPAYHEDADICPKLAAAGWMSFGRMC